MRTVTSDEPTRPERHLEPSIGGPIERSRVPFYFPQFRTAAALAHLAHRGRGPSYILIGGQAWYDPADIRAWLENNKQVGPVRPAVLAPKADQSKPSISEAPKRGRPTKLEQLKRRQAPSTRFDRRRGSRGASASGKFCRRRVIVAV